MSQLLRQARQRVDKVLKLVQVLKSHDFPHADSRKTLAFVETQFRELEDTLHHLDDSLHDPHTIRANCRSALEAVSAYLPVLGFVARSTDVVGALELHRPLHRIVTAVVGPDAHLLLTSDWQYSPYTYVHYQLIQEGFVLVGLPASEAGNGLIMPLAGHEIGHNMWYANSLDQHFEPLVSDSLVAEILNNRFKDFQDHFGPIEPKQVNDLAGRPYWEPAFAWAMAQCQEMFCDFVGLILFRESYLHAFQYLLSPAGGARDASYPPMPSRARHLIAAGKPRGFEISEDYAESFDEEQSDAKGKDEFLLALADKARESVIDQLLAKADEKLANYEPGAHSNEEKKRVHDAFTRATPVAGGVRLVNLVNAAWEIEISGIEIWNTDYPALAERPEERSRVLNELFLKSLEVLEIEKLQQESR
jgi:hypothetical protein